MQKTILSILCLLIAGLWTSIAGQTAANGDYRSALSGNWNNPAIWEKYNGTTAQWEPSVDFPPSQALSTTTKITIQSGTTVTLTAPVSVRNLWLNGKIVTTSTNILTVLQNYNITGGSTTAYVDGPMVVQIYAANVGKTLNFPIGKAGQGRPVTFTTAVKTASLTSYTAELFIGAPPAYNLPAGLGQISTVRYVRILKTGTALSNSAQIKLSYDIDDNVGNNNAQLRIARNDANGNWVDVGGSGSAPVSGTILSGYMNGYSNSDALGTVFALASTIVLPKITGNVGIAGAELSYFDGTAKSVFADANGNYSISLPFGWSGTITPSITGFSFNPASRTYTNLSADAATQNFTPVSLYKDYRTSVIGDWTDPAIWEAFDGTNWIASPNYPISVDGTVTIDSTAQVTMPVAVTINNGGKLMLKGSLSLGARLTIGAGGRLVNAGELINQNVGTDASPSYPGYLYVYGTYEHAKDGGMIGLSGNFGYTQTSWFGGSVCLITGMVQVAPMPPTQSAFYGTTMVWDCPNQETDAFLNFNSSYYYTAPGFKLLNSNNNQVYLFSGQGTSMRDVVVDGPNSKLTAFTRLSQGIEYLFFTYFSSLTVQNGGQFAISTVPGTSAHYGTINIQGNLTVTSGSHLVNYSMPSQSGVSYSRLVFPTNPNNLPHNIDLSGLEPITGIDGYTNQLNFGINSKISLSSPLTARTLDLNAQVTSNGNMMTILPGGSITNSISSTPGFTDGPVSFKVASTDPSVLNFPVSKGNSAYYAKLTVTDDTADTTTFTAEMTLSAPPQNKLTGRLRDVSSVRYFNITKSSGANVLSASMEMNYNASDKVNDNSLLRIAKNDGNGNWKDLGGSGSAPTSGKITSSKNFTDFTGGVFTLASSVYVPQGLISLWKLDESVSGTYADFTQLSNASGSTNPVAGKISGAQDFDGVTSKMSVPANEYFDFPQGSSFSVECWYKGSVVPTEFKSIMSRFIDAKTKWYLGIHTDGRARFYMMSNGVAASVYGSVVTDGQWHHIILTSNGQTGELKMYVDAVLKGSSVKVIPGGFVSPAAPLEIGSFNGGGLLIGSLDEVALHETALSSDLILAHYKYGLNGISYFIKTAPSITSAEVTSVTAGQPYTYDVNAVGNPDPKYYLTSFPQGMIIDSLTGVISWTPATAGSFNVMVEARNGVNPNAVQSFTITVAEGLKLPQGLISLWKLDEGQSGNYTDFTQRNNAAGSSNPVAGKISGAQDFDGTTSKISVPASASLDIQQNGNFSVECWYKGSTVPVEFKSIIGRYINAQTKWFMGIHTDGRARFYMMSNGVAASVYGSVITDGQWHHLAVTYTGSTGELKIYVDAALKGSSVKVIPGGFASAAAQVEIGSFNGGGLLTGSLDEVALHNVTLSPDVILEHYNYGLDGLAYYIKTAPAFTSLEVASATAGQPYTYDVNAIGNPVPKYYLTSFPEGMTIDSLTGVISWTPALGGIYTVSTEARNGVSPNAVQSFTITAADAAVMPQGLISLWKFDESASGNYADFTQMNKAMGSTAPVAGKVSGAQEFNGTSSKISVTANGSFDFPLGSSFSVECWYKGSVVPTEFKSIIGRFINSQVKWFMGIHTDGRARFYMMSNGVAASVYGSVVTDGNWHHLVVTYNGATGDLKMFVDAALKAAAVKVMPGDLSGPAKLEIGSYTDKALLIGDLDELAIHSLALTDAEVLQHYNNSLNGADYWNGNPLGKSNTWRANPVFELFKTSAQNEIVSLSWQTRKNVTGEFTLQRSEDGKSEWTTVASVTSAAQKEFSWNDRLVHKGNYSYKIKFTSTQGGYAFSDISEVKIVPGEYRIDQNFPNPFNPATTIKYEIPFDSRVSVIIYNITGEKVTELVNGIQSAGYYSYQWNASGLASGIYLLRIEAGDLASGMNFRKTLKMLMLK